MLRKRRMWLAMDMQMITQNERTLVLCYTCGCIGLRNSGRFVYVFACTDCMGRQN